MIQNLTIIGLGLLGGSIGLGTKKNASDCQITGCAHRDKSLIEAKSVGAIDDWTLDVVKAVKNADLVVLCMPVGQIPAWIMRIANHLKPGAIVTDVGSTKATICHAGEVIRPPSHFVGSHPMAGSEKTGVNVARADLFKSATCIVTPESTTDECAVQGVSTFWQTLGCRVVRHTPTIHDQLVATISHLPHAVAAALVGVQSAESLDLRGKGFLDSTRIAAGDPALWRDIFIENRDNLVDSLDNFTRELSDLSALLRDGDAAMIEKWLRDRAKSRVGL